MRGLGPKRFTFCGCAPHKKIIIESGYGPDPWYQSFGCKNSVYLLSFCNEYLDSVLPLETGRLSILAMSKLTPDRNSSTYILSISFTINFGPLLLCKRERSFVMVPWHLLHNKLGPSLTLQKKKIFCYGTLSILPGHRWWTQEHG